MRSPNREPSCHSLNGHLETRLANDMSAIVRFRNYIKRKLTAQQREKLRKALALRFRLAQHVLCSVLYSSNLRVLALLYGTDKWGAHWYCEHYEAHFKPIRHEKLTILEIGIGGYEDPESGGGSLRMWRTYFPRATIHAIDIFDKSPHAERRIKIYRGSQADTAFIERLCNEIGPLDIVIDDGSHINEHVLKSFQVLFPKLRENGIYVIEDTQTSYWEAFGGTSQRFDQLNTTKGWIKSLVDGLDFKDYERLDYSPTYFDKNIVAIHFYRNMIFIQKGKNQDGKSIYE
jgi:hypothetical protein